MHYRRERGLPARTNVRNVKENGILVRSVPPVIAFELQSQAPVRIGRVFRGRRRGLGSPAARLPWTARSNKRTMPRQGSLPPAIPQGHCLGRRAEAGLMLPLFPVTKRSAVMSRNHRLCLCLLVLCAALAIPPGPALARIKLITLPVRERVEIQLDHPSATLVEEERVVPLVAGVNQVDFSWANTRIDPDSILFRVLAPVGEQAMTVQVLSVSYPPNENALVWQVSANASGAARVRISYLLGNLSKSFNYRAVAAQDEKTLDLNQYIRVRNLANEAFGETGLWAGFGQRFLKPVGLNETKEMLMERYAAVPVSKTYTSNPAQFDYLDRAQDKLRVPMHYVLRNDRDNGMGRAPLQRGKVRIFQRDSAGTTAFIGEDWGTFTPVDDKMKLYLGVAKDVVVKRTVSKKQRHRVAGDLFHLELIVKYEIENFKDRPVTLDVVESLPFLRSEQRLPAGRDAQWELGPMTTFQGGLDREETTFDKAVFHTDLPARDAGGKAEKIVERLHVFIRNEW